MFFFLNLEATHGVIPVFTLYSLIHPEGKIKIHSFKKNLNEVYTILLLVCNYGNNNNNNLPIYIAHIFIF